MARLRIPGWRRTTTGSVLSRRIGGMVRNAYTALDGADDLSQESWFWGYTDQYTGGGGTVPGSNVWCVAYMPANTLPYGGVFEQYLTVGAAGIVQVWADPTTSLGVATKHYADTVAATGGTAATIAYSVVTGGTAASASFQQVPNLGGSGQVLTSQGAGTLPAWANVPSGFTNPMTTHGDMIYESAALAAAALAGNTSITKQFLTSTGSGGTANSPAWGVIAASDLPVPPFNVKSYGALGNGQYVSTGAITSGQATLTIGGGGATFASGDVGKNIIIYGAGAGGAHLGNATIIMFTDSTHVTISTNAGTTVTGAIVVWGTNDTTAIQAAVTAGGSAGSIYLPAGIYLVKAGFGNNLNGCRIYGDGAGSITDSQQAFASGSGTFAGSMHCLRHVHVIRVQLVASTTTASFREFDHLSVVWTGPGGKIFASEGVINAPAYIHDCRFEVNDPGGNGQVAASFVVDPFGEWARCGFIQTSSTRQLPLYQSVSSSSGQEANLTFSNCQWYNAGTDSAQYFVDIEFQGASSGGDGYAMQIAFRDCTFGRPWGGAVKMLGVINPVIDNCGLWDLADVDAPSVSGAANPGILYFGEYSASSPCRGVRLTGLFKNRNWADGSHVWDVYCESTTESVLIESVQHQTRTATCLARMFT